MSYKIMITGASGGFGKLIVEHLLKSGHSVVGTMRNVETKNAEVAGELDGELVDEQMHDGRKVTLLRDLDDQRVGFAVRLSHAIQL